MGVKDKTVKNVSKSIAIKKVNDDEQIVYGEVYAPNVIDTHGEMMLAEDIQKMAHRFMKHVDSSDAIDVMHDNNVINATPVESFVARANDPDYTSGAWVLGVKVDDASVWKSIRAGELNGYSFEARVKSYTTLVEIEYDTETIFTTEPAEDGHVHYAFVNVNDDGVVDYGKTSTTNGHSHKITKGTATGKNSGHTHRILV